MKNRRGPKTSKFRRPETSMHAALRAKVLEKRHRYKAVAVQQPLFKKTERSPVTAFRATVTSRSLPFDEVVGTSQTCSWHSPSASNHMVNAGDSVSLRSCFAKCRDYSLVGNLWLGDLWSTKPFIIFRATGSSDWHLALGHLPDSVVLAWPCKVITVEGVCRYDELQSRGTKAVMYSVFDERNYEACSLPVRSHAWQSVACKSCDVALPPGLRAFIVRGPLPIMEIAAWEAFWAIGPYWLVRFCKHRRWTLPLGGGGSLFKTLYWMVGHILNISEEQVLDIVTQRLAINGCDLSCADTVMHLDKAIHLLEKTDHAAVNAEKRHLASAAEQRRTFVEEYTEERKKAKAAVEARARCSSGPKAKARNVVAVGHVSVPSVISQAQAREFIPPGCSIWVGNTRGTWNGHCPPRARMSARWSDRDIIRRLWVQTAEVQAVPVESLVKFEIAPL